MVETSLTWLVHEAARGDGEAWCALVDRFENLVWAVARSHGLDSPDAADVAQTAWMRLAEHLDRIREPEKVGSWLVTAARFESMRVLRMSRRQVPAGAPEPGGVAPPADDPVLEAEASAQLWQAFDSLPLPCRQLLRVLMADPAPSYAEVGAALEMPIGSIGPRRARCLAHLRSCIDSFAADETETVSAHS